jgi:hypothetical protein
MFIRPIKVKKNGTNHKYWALVESYRTERGPCQRTVAYLGKLPDKVRRGVKDVAEGKLPSGQTVLFEEPEPEWVEVNTSGSSPRAMPELRWPLARA